MHMAGTRLTCHLKHKILTQTCPSLQKYICIWQVHVSHASSKAHYKHTNTKTLNTRPSALFEQTAPKRHTHTHTHTRPLTCVAYSCVAPYAPCAPLLAACLPPLSLAELGARRVQWWQGSAAHAWPTHATQERLCCVQVGEFVCTLQLECKLYM